MLAAYRANMDPFGGLVLAFAASISGGTLRDLILDRRPLYWTHDWVLLTVIICVGVGTMIYLRFWRLPHKSLLVVDAIGLSVVTVIGARAAIDAGATPLAVIILAVLTGVTGEVVRDVLCGEFPRCCCARTSTRSPRWPAPAAICCCTASAPEPPPPPRSRRGWSSDCGWGRSTSGCICRGRRSCAPGAAWPDTD